MVFSKARLALSTGLFLAWIGFLAYLVARTRDPVILSRPQLFVSSLVVIGDVKEQDGRPEPTVAVSKIAWTTASDDQKLPTTQLTIDGLADIGKAQGWRGPGSYILPLTKRKTKDGYAYEVTALPASPGYHPKYVTIDLESVGAEKDKVAALAHELTGSAGPIEPGILHRDVAPKDAAEFKKRAEALGAGVRLRDSETRIYRATPDALAQLDRLRDKEK